MDWSKTAVILNGKKMSLWRDNATINATAQGTNINWNTTTSSGNSQISGTLHRNEKVSFIPPRSFVRISRILLKTNFFNVSKADSHSEGLLVTTANGDTGKKYLFRKKTPRFNLRPLSHYPQNRIFLLPLILKILFG